jgi:hypothetical protein
MLLVAGGLVGGLKLGICLGGVAVLASFMEPARIGVLWGVCGLASIATFFGGSSRWIPQTIRQVDTSTFMEKGPVGAAFQWGRELGGGFKTMIVTPGFYALVGVCMASSPGVSILLGATYGASRGAIIATFALVVRRRARCGLPRSDVGLGIERFMRVPLIAATLVCAAAATR